jgi:hypothetical protein
MPNSFVNIVPGPVPNEFFLAFMPIWMITTVMIYANIASIRPIFASIRPIFASICPIRALKESTQDYMLKNFLSLF